MQGERFGRPSGEHFAPICLFTMSPWRCFPVTGRPPVVSAMEITPEGGSVKAEDSKTRGALLAVLLDG